MSGTRRTGPAGAGADGRANPLSLKPKELDALLDQMDAGGGGEAAARRQFARWPFRVTTASLRVGGAGSPTEQILKVVCRNISCGGMSVLHGSAVRAGSECGVEIEHPIRGRTVIPGVVTRCRAVRPRIHEIGIRFDAPIRARDFVDLDPFRDGFAVERVEPGELCGTVLYIDDSAMDRRLVEHYLRATRVRVRYAGAAAEGLALAREPGDLIICDLDLGEIGGGEVLARLRREGIRTPVVLIASDTGSLTRRRLAEASADAVLCKPLTQAMLHRCIAEFTMAGRGSGHRGGAVERGGARPDGFGERIPA